MTSPNGTALGTATSDPAAEQLFFEIFLTPRDDPYPAYRRLRETAPVLLTGDGTLVLTRFAECDAALRHRSFGKGNELAGFGLPGGAGEQQRQAQGRLGHSMLFANPPEHTRLRRSVGSVFTTRHIQDLRASIEDRTRKHLGQLARRSGGDFVDTLALPLPVNVIADLLGVPEEDRPEFSRHMNHSAGGVGGTDNKSMSHSPLEYLYEKFSAYIADRRANPRDDALTEMAAAKFPDGSTPEVMDVVRIAANLYTAGQETTVRLISTALKLIAEDAELQRELRKDRSKISNFIEECLRFESPVKGDFRLAKRKTSVGGVDVPAGATVMVMNGAANRDPAQFEDPNTLDIGRSNARRHLAFGRGPHSCPGAPLARAEARVSLERILDRTSDIRLSEEHHGPEGARRFNYVPTFILRGLIDLHLEVTPAEPEAAGG